MQALANKHCAVRPSGVSRRTSVAVSAKKTADGPRIAIVGITGAVGQEFLTVRLTLLFDGYLNVQAPDAFCLTCPPCVPP